MFGVYNVTISNQDNDHLCHAVKKIVSRYKGVSASKRTHDSLLNELHDLLDYMCSINGTDRVLLWKKFGKIVWDELGVYIGENPDLNDGSAWYISN